MSERSILVSELQSDFQARAAYVQAKVTTLVPSQIRGLRLKSDMPRQSDLAEASDMHQSRISMVETPGANPTISTLSAIAAGLKVGLVIKFVPFSEMLAWESDFSQDRFNVTKIDDDREFLNPSESLSSLSASSVAVPAAINSTSRGSFFYRPDSTKKWFGVLKPKTPDTLDENWELLDSGIRQPPPSRMFMFDQQQEKYYGRDEPTQ